MDLLREPIPGEQELRSARERFEALLRDPKTKEAEYQKLFAACPYVLSRTLPLGLKSSDIIPRGRPGRSEPDFIFHHKQPSLIPSYGVIEIKRADSSILTRPRKRVYKLKCVNGQNLQSVR